MSDEYLPFYAIGGGAVFGAVINWNYPQKYWIPWCLVIAGGSMVGLGGLFVVAITSEDTGERFRR